MDEFFGLIEGDVVSYDEPCVNRKSGSTDEFRGVVISNIEVSIENIKTSTGKTYMMDVCGYDIYADNPEYVGVYLLGIYDEDYKDVDNSYPEDRRKFVGSGEIRN